jgi:hypothetical protein
MAYCEKCGQKGFDPRQMRVDDVNRIFVGPCCLTVVEIAPPGGGIIGEVKPAEWDYGIEVSKHMGVVAYAAYGGMKVEFKRTAQELQGWWQEQQRLQSQA